MHNKVVYHAMKAFSSVGLPVVRFNFRGTGLSEGEHDEGRGERDDVLAVLDWMETNLKLPILFAGFSFGSNVGLRACCGDARVKGLIGLGVPVQAEGRDYSYGFLRSALGRSCLSAGITTSSGHGRWLTRSSGRLRSRRRFTGSRVRTTSFRGRLSRPERSWGRCRRLCGSGCTRTSG